MTNESFLTQVADIVERLKLARASITHKKQALHAEIDQLKARRTQAMRAHAERMLPDLEPETLAALQKKFPKFVTNAVRAIFVDAETMDIPWTTRWFGDPKAYRVQALAQDMNMLQILLAAAIVAIKHDDDEMLSELADLQELDAQIIKADEMLRKLDAQDIEIEERVTSLTAARAQVFKNPTKRVSREIAQSIQQSTQGYQSSNASSEDDMTDFLIYWATGLPTSFRTLAVSVLFSDNDAPRESHAHEMATEERAQGVEMRSPENTDTEDNSDGSPTPEDNTNSSPEEDIEECQPNEDSDAETEDAETEDAGDLS